MTDSGKAEILEGTKLCQTRRERSKVGRDVSRIGQDHVRHIGREAIVILGHKVEAPPGHIGRKERGQGGIGGE
jgi:hypothetical protein